MTSIANRRRVATELTAAADAYKKALDGPSWFNEYDAADRLKRAIEAATALLQAAPVAPGDAPTEFRPGDRVLWLNTTATAHGEQLTIEHATVGGEAHPDSTAPTAEQAAERWYALESDVFDWTAPAGDLIALPPMTAEEIRRAG